jgi:hypothetical protein
MAVIVGVGLALPLGVLLGYKWRDRISKQRRAEYWAQQNELERREREIKAKSSSTATRS